MSRNIQRSLYGIFLSFAFLSVYADESAFRPDGCGFDHTLEHTPILESASIPNSFADLKSAMNADASPQGVPIYTIPVVYHVVHGGGAENITDQQIQESVAQMNEDYNGLDENRNDVVSAFAGIYANVGFNFVLARKDPNGNPTDGITRNFDPNRSTVFNDGNESGIKPAYGWPRNKYMNVFVVRSAGGESGSAWAYLPGVSASLDGVISSHWAVGRTGTATPTHFKILTHEVGHWANLHHTFSGGCVTPGSSNNGDLVADTPPTTAGSGCNLISAPCGELGNTQNYMDYGTCTIMFTLGQESRMRAAIQSSASQRNSLWQHSNLVATGVAGQAVSALFNTSKNVTAVGGSLSFNDVSEAEVGVITDWQWTFQGGTPGSYSGPNPPPITYNTAGTYSVTLRVGNSNGDTNTVIKNDYAIVSNDLYMHDGSETLCSGSLKDSGLDGKYGNREDHELTLLPSNSSQSVRLSFSSFALESSTNCANDFLKIYNGDSDNAPLIGTYCGSNSPGTVTANNGDNALHLVFHSNLQTRADGWEADISCAGGGSSSGGSSSGGSSSGGSSSGGVTILYENQSRTISGQEGSQKHFKYTIPSGEVGKVVTWQGSGDMDLYVKKGSTPTLNDYDCRSWTPTTKEECLDLEPGTYFVLIHGFKDYANVKLKGRLTSESGPTVTTLQENSSIVISGAQGSEKFYQYTIPSGGVGKVVTWQGSGNPNLYVKKGSLPTLSSYDCRSINSGTVENCLNLGGGTYYVLVHGASSYSSVKLKGRLTN